LGYDMFYLIIGGIITLIIGLIARWQKCLPITRYYQKRGWTASIGHLCKVQHSFFAWTFVLKIPAFGNTRTVGSNFIDDINER
jgi:hypothetical protein